MNKPQRITYAVGASPMQRDHMTRRTLAVMLRHNRRMARCVRRIARTDGSRGFLVDHGTYSIVYIVSH